MNAHPRPHPGMARISLFGIAAILMLAGIVAWASPTHSAVKDVIGPSPIDPLSLMATAKNLPSMHVAEVIGYVAAVLVFTTFYMKTMIPLRIVGICSNCAFIMYGYLDGLYPVLILHLILLPLNSLRLREMLKLIKQVREATGGDPNMDWLKPFTSTRHVQPGEKVFHKGEPGRDMFVVMSGRFRLVETGIELKARDVVGEFALLTPKHRRTQTLECTEAGILLQITYGQVEQLFFQNARFGFYFLQLIAHRLLQNNERLEMELGYYRRAPVIYRPRWQRALSRTEKSAILGNESPVVRHNKSVGYAVG